MDYMEQFEAYLREHLPKTESFHPHYNEALAKMIVAGGKRFRPRLLLNVVNALEPRLLENAYPVALGVELLHTYSLIHDDLPAMDNADLRRGHTTLHREYDEVTAILAGDALNTHAFYMLANAPLDARTVVRLVRSLSSDGGVYGMVLGQAIDCHFEDAPLSLEQVEFLHRHKTGVLIAASLKMGAIVCDAGKELEDALYDFGVKLGLLFQVEDDIIDVTQSSEEAGKTTNNDEDKNSFVNLMGLDETLAYKSKLLEELEMEANASFPTPLARTMIDTMNRYFKKSQ